jgi:hypothetical protein
MLTLCMLAFGRAPGAAVWAAKGASAGESIQSIPPDLGMSGLPGKGWDGPLLWCVAVLAPLREGPPALCGPPCEAVTAGGLADDSGCS